jgi:pimeloyl-ACP methyl ester carboxylesterase
LDAFGSRRRIEPFLRAVMKRRVSDEVVQRLVDDALVCQDEHWFGVEQWASVDFSGRLAAITAPALVLAGANDPLASPGRLKREVAAAIHGSVFVVLKDAGHNLPVELPGDIAAAIERF